MQKARRPADFPGIKFTIADMSGLHEGNRRTSLILGESYGCRGESFVNEALVKLQEGGEIFPFESMKNRLMRLPSMR